MLVDLNNAASVVEWWAVFPQRHGALLADWANRRPEHRATILQARRAIEADPELRLLLAGSRTSRPSVDEGAAVLSHDELAAGEGRAADASAA